MRQILSMFDAWGHNWSGELEGVGALISSLDSNSKEKLFQRCQAKAGDLILFAVGDISAVNKTLDWLRRYIAEKLNIIDEVLLPSYIIHMLQTLWILHRSPSCWLVFLMLVTVCSFNLLDYRLSYVWVEWFRTAFWGIWTFLFSIFYICFLESMNMNFGIWAGIAPSIYCPQPWGYGRPQDSSRPGIWLGIQWSWGNECL